MAAQHAIPFFRDFMEAYFRFGSVVALAGVCAFFCVSKFQRASLDRSCSVIRDLRTLLPPLIRLEIKQKLVGFELSFIRLQSDQNCFKTMQLNDKRNNDSGIGLKPN